MMKLKPTVQAKLGTSILGKNKMTMKPMSFELDNADFGSLMKDLSFSKDTKFTANKPQNNNWKAAHRPNPVRTRPTPAPKSE